MICSTCRYDGLSTDVEDLVDKMRVFGVALGLSHFSHLSACHLSLQLFTEYGRLAMEETFLKPFQVLQPSEDVFLFINSVLEVEFHCCFFFYSP